MQKKLKYLATTIILTIFVVSVIAIGIPLTPAAFKAINIDDHDFNPTPAQNEIKNGKFVASVSIKTFKEIETGYEAIEKNKSASFTTASYSKCRQTETESDCLTKQKERLVNNIVRKIVSEKNWLKNEQAKLDYAHELTPNSIRITAADIQNAMTPKEQPQQIKP